MDELDELLDSSLEIVEQPSDLLFSEEEFADVLPGDPGKKAIWEKRRDVGNTGLGDSQWDKTATIEEIDKEGGLNKKRAALQPWQDQLGNAITQAVVGEIVGGTIEGLGYLMDWQGIGNLVAGNEKEFTNWFSDIGKSIREKTQEATQIYEETPGEMNLSDPGYWFKNSVSVASTLSMMIPSMAATKGLGMIGRGVSKIAGRAGKSVGKSLGREISKEAFDVASQMGIKANWMTEGISQAVVSRHIENSMESSGTFQDIYNEKMMQINPKTGVYFTDEEAKALAAEGAADNYKHGWAMLAQDMVQYLSIGKVFNPVTRQMEVARKMTTSLDVPSWVKKGAGALGTFASEGFEEGYQHYISSRAKLKTDLQAGLISQEEYNNQLSEVMSSDEAKTSMLFGGLGGSVFQMIGPKVNKAFQSKDRKEFEANAAENFNSALADRNKVLAALQIEKNKADQLGTQREIEAAQDDIMLSMILDGINNDNLEMVMTSIKDGPEMSSEEKTKFEEDNGYEWNSELAKSNANRALKIAQEVKEIHFKNLNKAKNRNVQDNIIKAMTAIEYQNKKYSEKSKQSEKEQQERIDSIRYDGIRKPSDNFKTKKDVESRILATQEIIKRQTAALEKTIDKDVKKTKSDIIKNHNYNLSRLKEEFKELSKPQDEQSRDQKKGDELAAKVYNKDVQFEIADGYVEQLEYNDAITENQAQLTKLNDKEFQQALINKQTKALIDSTTDKDMLNTFKQRVEKGEVAGYSRSSEKQKVLDQIDSRLKAIEKEEAEARAKQINKKAEAEIKQDAKTRAKNPKNPPNSVVNVPVQEAIEDENVDEERYFEEEIAQEQDKAYEVKVGTGKSIALLDADSVTSAGYREWIHNGQPKEGVPVRFELSKRGSWRGNPEHPSAKAVSAFNAAVKNKREIPQSVYDYFPIQAFVGDGDKINTFLPDASAGEGSAVKKKRYEENYATERRNIIDALARGEKVETVIANSSGGQLQLQPSESGTVAENNIKDLKQIKDSGKEPHIVFSDLDGNLIEMDKKTRNAEFRNKQLSVGENEDGTPQPYRGGLFLIIRKADGTPFPVRLNFLKNTNEQAEVLADLLVDIAVPTSKEKGTPKKYTLSTPLSLLDPDLKKRVEEQLGPEVELLKKKNSDPILKDIINMFVYVSPKTEGLTSQLYMSGVNLYFGDGNNHVNPGNRESKKQELIDYLRDVKRRQVNLNMWNDQENYPGYRDFIIDNRIINTNVVVGQPEFQTETREQYEKSGGEASGRDLRRVQVRTKPVDSKVPAKQAKIKKTAPVKKVVEPVIGAENVITEATGPSLVEINAAVAKAFPGKMYQYGITVKPDGTAVTKVGGKLVSKEDVDAINKIKDDMQTKFDAKKITIDEDTTDVTKNDDTKISDSKEKDVPSVPTRTIRTRGRKIGSGSTTSKPRTRTQSDDKVNKEDDTKQPRCSKKK